ncbi:MAG: hypothetical protein WC371_01370 [Parachlamydiales bacterium]|jgi:hypothetical protein
MPIKIFKQFFFVFLAVEAIFAAPVNNPASARSLEKGFFFSGKWFSFRLGYEGDFILDRRLKEKGAHRIEDFSQNCNSGFLVLNLLNRLDLYGVMGEAKYEADWILKESSSNFGRLEMETRYNWKWAVGGKAIFFEWGDVTLAFGGRYAKTEPRLSWLSYSSAEYSLYKPGQAVCSFVEWQVDGEISYKIDFFIPYVAMKYSRAYVDLKAPEITVSSFGLDEIKMRSRDFYGAACGCGFCEGKYFQLNAEVRLFDEEAFTVTGEFRF